MRILAQPIEGYYSETLDDLPRLAQKSLCQQTNLDISESCCLPWRLQMMRCPSPFWNFQAQSSLRVVHDL